MYKIQKAFDLCYGHRVWTQQLDSQYSDNQLCACRHLHGHQGKIRIGLESRELKNGMVTDFHHLNWFKKWLDTTLDHKMVLDMHDPILYHLGLSPLPMITNQHVLNGFVTHWTFANETSNSDFIEPKARANLDAKRELRDGIVLVDFVPTSENLAKFVFDVVNARMNEFLGNNIKVGFVEWNETPKSSSTYFGE